MVTLDLQRCFPVSDGIYTCMLVCFWPCSYPVCSYYGVGWLHVYNSNEFCLSLGCQEVSKLFFCSVSATPADFKQSNWELPNAISPLYCRPLEQVQWGSRNTGLCSVVSCLVRWWKVSFTFFFIHIFPSWGVNLWSETTAVFTGCYKAFSAWKLFDL